MISQSSQTDHIFCLAKTIMRSFKKVKLDFAFNTFPCTAFPCPHFISLSKPLIVYLLYSCPSLDISKINKQGCGLVRKGYGNAVIDYCKQNFLRLITFLLPMSFDIQQESQKSQKKYFSNFS